MLRQPRGQESSRVEATSAPRPRVQQSGGYVSPEAKSPAEWRLQSSRVEATLAARPRVLQSGGCLSRGPESSRVEATSAGAQSPAEWRLPQQGPRVQQSGGYISRGPESSRVEAKLAQRPRVQQGGDYVCSVWNEYSNIRSEKPTSIQSLKNGIRASPRA
ncbi:unnamed protein product [Boreogadus saida]